MKVALVAGPGGSGVTTVAALTAVAAADRGRRTLLLSSDPLIAPILGAADRERLRLVRPDAAADITAARGRLTGYLKALGIESDVDPAQFATLPGMHQLATLFAVAAAARSGEYDALVLDAGTGLVDLLALPETVGRLTDTAIPTPMRILRQVSNLFGGRPAGPVDPSADLIGDLLDRLLLARAVLIESTGAAVHLVTDPRPLRRAAAVRLVPMLAVHGAGLGRVVHNNSTGDDDGRDSAGPGWPAETLVIGREPAEPVGAALDALARTVFADRDPLEVTAGPALIEPLVERTDTGFRLQIAAPMADRTALGLARSGGDLLITVHGRTRRTELPSVLRRCVVQNAEFEGGTLTVTFRPDPAQWPQALDPDGTLTRSTADARTSG